ncbi:MAG: hypothetical protein Tsb0013_11870 [Phycisphaerales bacterium]
MITLAQRVAMDHLPGGPALDVWLYERPIPTMIALIALGMIGAYVLRQRQQSRWWLAPLIAGMVLATGVWSLASVVETGRESMRRGTSAFVQAMVTGDRPGARSLLSTNILLAAAGTEYPITVDELAAASERAQRYVDSYNLRRISSTLDGRNAGRTRFEVTIGADGSPIPMGWELAWQRRGGSWVIVRAECLQIYNMAPQNMFRNWLPVLRR